MTEELKRDILNLVYLYTEIGSINQEEFFERLENTLDIYHKPNKIQP
jgi:hypothetical protein